MRLIRLGYWKSDTDPSLPDRATWVHPDWDDDERFEVAAYVRSGTFARHFMGHSTCRLCGALNGTSEFTDGTYLWPQGLHHYVDAHGVRLPAEFVAHARSRLDQLDSVEVDEMWWRQQPPVE